VEVNHYLLVLTTLVVVVEADLHLACLSDTLAQDQEQVQDQWKLLLVLVVAPPSHSKLDQLPTPYLLIGLDLGLKNTEVIQDTMGKKKLFI
jgi:hypothetical protein